MVLLNTHTQSAMIREVMAQYSIGLDLGGTNLRAAAVTRTGEMLGIKTGRTAFAEGRDAIVDDMVEAIRALRDEYGPSDLAGIGVAVPGFIELEKGVIRNSNNLSSLENFPIRDVIGERLGTPVILENDANAAALGEKWIGAGRTVNDLVLVTLGTGIGGGIVIDGKILRGFMGMAGEVGHISIDPQGNPCGCGNRGCVEKHASATAISAMARLLLGEAYTSKQVYDMALAGNERAKTIFTVMGESLGILLAMLINAFNFPLYLLSGGPLDAWDLFAPAMLAEVKRRSVTARVTNTVIAKAELGNQAGLFGASYLPWMK